MNKVIFSRVLAIIAKMKGGTQAGLQLLKSIPPKALVEGLGRVLWTQRPWYQKPAMLAIGLRIVYYSIRGLMILCIIIHNKLYYPYHWLDKASLWIVNAPFRFFFLAGKNYRKHYPICPGDKMGPIEIICISILV